MNSPSSRPPPFPVDFRPIRIPCCKCIIGGKLAMHIKQISIQGFKSYKDQTIIEPFSPNHNVVVGRNGSGKSNFFAAIRFVLNDSYNRMSQEERQSLLHEGSGVATLSAYVEIVFDNSDNRFPTGKPDVTLRRTIGLKKDEYSLDRKAVTKSEVMNLLTSAGFSKANPYYIVPQGRITWLTNAKDNERLELLKEVAGTTLYEEHRRESLKLMEESAMKREKIDEMLVFIDERIQELEEEKQDLTEFTELDKQKRACEYTCKNRELEQTRAELVTLDSKCQGDLESYEQERTKCETLNEKLQKAKEQEDLKKLLIADMEEQLKMLEEEKNGLLKARTRFEFLQKQKAPIIPETSDPEEREKLAAKIEQKQRQLEQKLVPTYNEKLTAENALREQLASLEVQRDTMAEMKGRFRTKKERDAWIKSETEALQSSIRQEGEEQQKLVQELAQADEKLVELSVEIDTLKTDRQAVMNTGNSLLNEYLEQRNQLSEKRKEAWKKENQTQTEISIKKSELVKFEKNLHLLGCGVSVIHTIDKLVQELGIEASYFGPIYRLISLDATYYEAVDAVVGNGLFHVVVDTDQTARQILTVLQERKLGRVTFIPLNRINPQQISYPQNKNEGIPLISILQYDSTVEKAIKEVFSKYFICPTLEIASKIAKACNLNTVTLDGDKVDKRGALTGGYSKSSEHKGRLETLMNYNSLFSELTKKEQKLLQYSHQVKSLDLQINSLVSKIFQQENEKMKNQAQLDEWKSQLHQKEQERILLEKNCENKRKALQNYSFSINGMNMRLNSLDTEGQSPFVASHFDDDVYKALQRQIATVNQNLLKILKEKSNIECMKNAIQDEIENCLKKRLERLDESPLEIGFIGEGAEVFDQRSLDSIQAQINTLLSNLEESRETLVQLAKSNESVNNEIETCNRVLSNLSASACSYGSIRTVLSQKQEQLSEQIKQLGILSSESLTKFRRLNDSQISNQLLQLNDKLKKFAHVNKRALEQYQSFIGQRERLLERKKDLSASSESIVSFISTLDQQKDQTIMNTFEQVSQYFGEIFTRLVPSGHGELVLIREENNNQLELRGIQIKVSFDRSEQSILMSQLSGGQKSVVALALIFAIQRVDPAPFYLFDEIDANLDTAYRASVAALLHELSRTAQYITTTFRPELLEEADKFYGVQFINRVSHVGCITKDVALDFIEKQIAK